MKPTQGEESVEEKVVRRPSPAVSQVEAREMRLQEGDQECQESGAPEGTEGPPQHRVPGAVVSAVLGRPGSVTTRRALVALMGYISV